MTSILRVLSLVTLSCGIAATAHAQVEIYASDDVSFKLGILGQFQADTLTDPPTTANTDNLFVRRLRLMVGGQVAKKVTFFVETDTPNLGKTVASSKVIPPSTVSSTII